MERFTLHRRFGLAIVAYRAFHHLLSPDAQRSCLAHLRRHLRRGGRLVIHLYDPRLDLCDPAAVRPPSARSTVHDPASGCDVAVAVTDRVNDAVTQTLSEIWRWTVSRNGAVVRTFADELRLRWTYRYEMRYLFELTGFTVLAEYSDFKGSPPRYGAEQVWVVARM